MCIVLRFGYGQDSASKGGMTRDIHLVFGCKLGGVCSIRRVNIRCIALTIIIVPRSIARREICWHIFLGCERQGNMVAVVNQRDSMIGFPNFQTKGGELEIKVASHIS